MNNTNRALNRAVIFLIGLALLLTGAAATAIALIPAIRDPFTTSAQDAPALVSSWLQASPVATSDISWISIGLLALLLLVVLLLVAFIVRQGNGHTGTLHIDTATGTGTTILDTSVAEHSLQEALSTRPEILSSHVTSYDVRGTSVLKVTAVARRGVSPKDIADTIDSHLRALDRLLGIEIPALVQISGGLRTHINRSTRLQ